MLKLCCWPIRCTVRPHIPLTEPCTLHHPIQKTAIVTCVLEQPASTSPPCPSGKLDRTIMHHSAPPTLDLNHLFVSQLWLVCHRASKFSTKLTFLRSRQNSSASLSPVSSWYGFCFCLLPLWLVCHTASKYSTILTFMRSRQNSSASLSPSSLPPALT